MSSYAQRDKAWEIVDCWIRVLERLSICEVEKGDEYFFAAQDDLVIHVKV